MMTFIRTFSRFFVGILFVFSGLIKVNDPVGFSIKLEEYFHVFSDALSYPDPGEEQSGYIPSEEANEKSVFQLFFELLAKYALTLAIIISVLEILLGVNILFSFHMKFTTWALLFMILFFTWLTFYSAYYNKVTDCGCFGDAIPLTPWQSFAKDIILLVFIGILFISRSRFWSFLEPKWIFTIQGLTVVATTFLAINAVKHLPYMDFRAYKVGANIPKLMKASAPIKYRYIMEKDGDTFEFDEYPSDTSYQYKEMYPLNPGDMPKITDFNVWNEEGDFTDSILQDKKLLIIIDNTKYSDISNFDEINTLVNSLANTQITPLVLTATEQGSFEEFRHQVQLAVPYYFADGTVLKTMVRANPGIILIEDGVVKGKWHSNDIPKLHELESQLNK